MPKRNGLNQEPAINILEIFGFDICNLKTLMVQILAEPQAQFAYSQEIDLRDVKNSNSKHIVVYIFRVRLFLIVCSGLF